MRSSFISVLLASTFSSVFAADPVLTPFANSLTLDQSFQPIKAAYWTGLPHHRRTPFSVSPDGLTAYISYLAADGKTVVVQGVSPTTFAAVGTAVSFTGYEAAGLVAQNDGFAVMATVNATGTTDLPTDNEPIVSLIRYKAGVEAWRTPLNGPGVHASAGLTATPDANGDLVYSEKSGLYAAYFVVTAYTGDAAGHFGDSIQYVDDTGSLQTSSYSSTFGCSHNTGIGLEAADAPPFASVCAEDHGAIWLNTDTQYMSGVKIANENTTNGVSGEPMGGMSGSYSNLALFPGTTQYIFGWQSRGALDLTTDTWMGSPYTFAQPRWLNHNVAIATLASKDKLTGAEATSTVGAAEGDTQVNWITESTTEDHQNVHVAGISSTLSVVSWETLTSPDCQPVPLGCSGTYAGTSFQFVDNTGAKVGSVVSSTSVFVSGDMALVGDKVCWPYVDMTWDLSAPKDSAAAVTKMSFACVGTGAASTVTSSSVAAVATSASASSVAAVASSVASVVSSVVPVVSSVVPVVSSAVPTTSAIPVTSGAEADVTSSTLPAFSSVVTPAASTIATFPAVSQITTAPAASSEAASSVVVSVPTIASSVAQITTAPALSVPVASGTATHLGGYTSGKNTFTARRSRGGWSYPNSFTTFATIVKPSAIATAVPVPEDDSCEFE